LLVLFGNAPRKTGPWEYRKNRRLSSYLGDLCVSAVAVGSEDLVSRSNHG